MNIAAEVYERRPSFFSLLRVDESDGVVKALSIVVLTTTFRVSQILKG